MPTHIRLMLLTQLIILMAALWLRQLGVSVGVVSLLVCVMPLAWGYDWLARTRGWRHRCVCNDYTSASNIIGSGIYIVGLTIMAGIQHVGLVSEATGTRIMYVWVGLWFIRIGNIMPKRLGPLADETRRPEVEQALRQLSSRAYILAGVSYVAIFGLLPEGKIVPAVIVFSIVYLVAYAVRRDQIVGDEKPATQEEWSLRHPYR